MKLSNEDLLTLKKSARILRAINHKLRIRIYDYLCESERTVTETLVHFRLEQSVASQHLAILRKEGWVTTRRDGKFIYYAANDESGKRYLKMVNDLVKIKP